MQPTHTTTTVNHKPAFSGGQLLVQTLEKLDTQRIFSVPGESYLPVLDALYDSPITNTICRQEGGAAMAAEAWGKATGKPGICFVTRGPGATNASAGVHVAQQDSTPMILFIGQINTRNRHKEGFQEVDYMSVFQTMTKWVAEIDCVERVEEMVARAWSIAISGRPGPVVLALPENMLFDAAPAPATAKIATLPIFTYPSPSQISTLVDKLDTAERPLIVVGGSGWDAESVAKLETFAKTFNVPVACSFRRQMLFNHYHSHYAGDLGLAANPALLNSFRTADLIILLGCRFSEIPSQNFKLLNIPAPQIPLIHIHSGAEELHKLYHADMTIHASPVSIMSMLSEAESQQHTKRQPYTTALHSQYLEWSTLPTRHYPGAVQMPIIMQDMQTLLPKDAIICNGAGNYASWIHRFWRFQSYGSQFAPTSGSMGYGLPAAIAGKLCEPTRTVVCWTGDGCFQMTQQELATAVQAKAQLIIIVVDNGIYGTIRMHQEKHFPGRESGTRMVNPDFAKLGDAYGINTYTVNQSAEFKPALQAALATDSSTLIHIILDEQVITPTATIDEIRQQA